MGGEVAVVVVLWQWVHIGAEKGLVVRSAGVEAAGVVDGVV